MVTNVCSLLIIQVGVALRRAVVGCDGRLWFVDFQVGVVLRRTLICCD